MKKQKLFENVGGNQFKLLTESKETIQGSDLVREGLKKVFANGFKEISYQRLQGVGMGYIKDVNTARKCAIQESQDLAPQFGYTDDADKQKFVKSAPAVAEQHPETDMANPEEKREVQIGRDLLKIASENGAGGPSGTNPNAWDKVVEYANELIQMHGQKQ